MLDHSRQARLAATRQQLRLAAFYQNSMLSSLIPLVMVFHHPDSKDTLRSELTVAFTSSAVETAATFSAKPGHLMWPTLGGPEFRFQAAFLGADTGIPRWFSRARCSSSAASGQAVRASERPRMITLRAARTFEGTQDCLVHSSLLTSKPKVGLSFRHRVNQARVTRQSFTATRCTYSEGASREDARMPSEPSISRIKNGYQLKRSILSSSLNLPRRATLRFSPARTFLLLVRAIAPAYSSHALLERPQAWSSSGDASASTASRTIRFSTTSNRSDGHECTAAVRFPAHAPITVGRCTKRISSSSAGTRSNRPDRRVKPTTRRLWDAKRSSTMFAC
mmetsp:Transcript_7688/g.23990  ORF Transcript_7688/g.23990 Transcript_7688/m.23990 type:complete len:336 (-) Transcript_7688:542-1549(-)